MNQVDRIIENVFSITTGDGIIFNTFNWSHRAINIPINGRVYNYPGRQGSKVDRRLLKSPIYNIEFWIGGEDASAKLSEFLKSASDLNPWTIDHPVFGLLIGHPVESINGNPSRSINGFLISFRFIESNIDEAVSGRDNTLKRIESISLESNLANQEIYLKTTDVQITDRTNGLEVIKNLNAFFEDIAALNDVVGQLENLVGAGIAAVDNIVEAPATALKSLQQIIDLPGQLKAKINAKLDVYQQTINGFADIFNINSFDSAKSLGAMNYASAIQNMAISAVADASRDTDDIIDIDDTTGAPQKSSLRTQTEIAEAIDLIISEYNNFIIYFDEIGATSTSTGVDAVAGIGYKLNETTVENLKNLVLICTINLTDLLRNSQPESVYFTFEKVNPVNLFVQLYDFYDEDKFNEFVLANNFKANEMVEIPVNRKILYYP